MDNSKPTNYTLPLKSFGARPWNIQTIYDAIKKCRGNRQAESDLNMQVRQMTTNLYEYFEEELDNILSLSPDERKIFLGDVQRYIQKLFEWLKDGKGKDDLDLTERERLTSEYTFLVKRLRDLQQSAEMGRDTTPAKRWEIWPCIKRIPRWIYAKISHLIGTIIVGIIITVVIDILYDFGLIAWIKTIVLNILTHK